MLDVYSRLGIALGLGLLVGLQRQRTDPRLAGFRTFPLVILFGALCGLLAQVHGGWIVAAGLGALSLVIVGGNLPLVRAVGGVPGVTTEVTMLLVFALGVYVMVGSPALAITTCGAVVVLLHLKPQMHSLAEKIGDEDFRAIIQFALISLVILPVLPNRAYGPYEVLNPFRIWLMVVLIVGISLGGYVAYKLVGIRGGAWTSAILGGLISSTATTVSITRQSLGVPENRAVGVFVILIASSVSLVRVGILLAATAPHLFQIAWPPLSAMAAVLALAGWGKLRLSRDAASSMPRQSNPSELKPALMFGVLYGVILLTVAAANEHLGRQGLYVATFFSGLAEMDAITLSVSEIVNSGDVGWETGWRLIVVAAIANLGFKCAIVLLMSEGPLRSRVVRGFVAAMVSGILLLLFWPNSDGR